jgi:parallel beta-helix repeat protein
MKFEVAVLLITILATDHVFAQGALVPSAGPAETMKTLQQIEPRTDIATLAGSSSAAHVISQSGSYYLTGNIQAALNKHGIIISADNVAIDLAGFSLIGAGKAVGSTGHGISALSRRNITVRNGTIREFRQEGINANNGTGLVAEKLIVENCGSAGIHGYANVIVRECQCRENAGYGILANGTLLADRCMADGNTSIGIGASGDGSVIRGCVAQNNGSTGISVGSASTITDCTTRENGGTGISAGAGSSLNNCTAYYNDSNFGMFVSDGSVLQGCTANYNTGTSTHSYGIYAASACSVIACTARFNNNTNTQGTGSTGAGIYASSASTVAHCSARYNEGDGIRVSDDTTVMSNTSANNGNGGTGAGIHATGSDNRVDSNNVANNDYGIHVSTNGNLVVRNSASGNSTNYEIATGNDTGTIQTTPVGAGAWDNFQF